MAYVARFAVGRGISKRPLPLLSPPHIIIHDEVSKSERDGFPIDLSSTVSFLPASALADVGLIVF